jgi:hypothetical protein
MEGREMHSLVAGKSQLSFSVAADEDVGKVDRRSGKVTFVGQSPLEMVRGHLHTQCGCFSTGILHRLLIVALTGGYVQMAAFIAFLLSKKVSVVNEDGEPIGES